MNLSDLILALQNIEAEYGGHLPVMNDMEDELLAAEYSDENGKPAVVLVLGD